MKDQSKILSIVFVAFLIFSAPKLVKAFSITEAWDQYNVQVEFIVDNSNPTYDDIVEFVVGNNDAWDAYVENSLGWQGTVAVNYGDEYPNWYYYDEIPLLWLNEIEEFNSYNRAFYFWADAAVWQPLPEGESRYFFGMTVMPASPFAIRNRSGTVVATGHTNVVPIPTTLLLLFTGLAAIGFGTARRKR